MGRQVTFGKEELTLNLTGAIGFFFFETKS